MFIPSMYKSTPQIVAASSGVNTIPVAINPNFTRITNIGPRSSNTGGTVSPNRGLLQLTGSTTFTLTSPMTSAGICRVLVEEFIGGFFRQNFQYGTIFIGSGAASGATAHGLTLGTKAFALPLGSYSNRTSDPNPPNLSLAESQVMADVIVSGANVVAQC